MITGEQLKKINPKLANLSNGELAHFPDRDIISLKDASAESGGLSDTSIITVGEYRKILDDYASSDSQIKQRLQYLEAFCRNIIQDNLEKYVAQNRKKI